MKIRYEQLWNFIQIVQDSWILNSKSNFINKRITANHNFFLKKVNKILYLPYPSLSFFFSADFLLIISKIFFFRWIFSHIHKYWINNLKYRFLFFSFSWVITVLCIFIVSFVLSKNMSTTDYKYFFFNF